MQPANCEIPITSKQCCLADWLKQNLDYYQISSNRLSVCAGLRPSTLDRIIKGQTTAPRIASLRKIQTALDLFAARDSRHGLVAKPQRLDMWSAPITHAQVTETPDDKLNRTPLAAWLKVLRHLTASGKTPDDVLRAIDTLNNFFSGERHA